MSDYEILSVVLMMLGIVVTLILALRSLGGYFSNQIGTNRLFGSPLLSTLYTNNSSCVNNSVEIIILPQRAVIIEG